MATTPSRLLAATGPWRRRAVGTAGAEDAWLQKQLQRTDGYAEPSGASSGDMQPR